MKKMKLKIGFGTVLTCLAFLTAGCAQTRLAAADGTVVVSAVPVVASGTNGLCPGGFVGYVNYLKTPAQGWGWAPTNTVHTVTDTNRTDTKVDFQGKLLDYGCNQTTVTIPNPTVSPKYRFCVYFTNNVPTNAYLLLLQGFSP
jgi:hypothetical protein